MKEKNQEEKEIDVIKNYIKQRMQQSKKPRFNFVGNYKFDRYIFLTAMVLVFCFLFYIAYSNNFELDYFYCPLDSQGSITGNKFMLRNYEVENVERGCKNPFFRDTWKNKPYLEPGEYGNKPGPLFKSAGKVSVLLIVLAVLLNHFWHNKKEEKKHDKDNIESSESKRI